MLCQQTWPQHWFANVNMTSYCDIANSLYSETMTTIHPCSIVEFGRGHTIKQSPRASLDLCTPLVHRFYLMLWCTVISRLSSQLESELFVRTYVVCANLAVVLLTVLANRCWSLGLMFWDWLMLWLKLTIFFSKAYSTHLHPWFSNCGSRRPGASFWFSKGVNKSKIQCGFIQWANNSKIQCSFIPLPKNNAHVRSC